MCTRIERRVRHDRNHGSRMNATEELRQIRRAQNDISQFSPLYQQFVHLVWNYCLARLRDDDRAADATSTTFLKAMKALPRYKPELRSDQTTFRSWLMTIARNVVLDELRNVSRQYVDSIRPHHTTHSNCMDRITPRTQHGHLLCIAWD